MAKHLHVILFKYKQTNTFINNYKKLQINKKKKNSKFDYDHPRMFCITQHETLCIFFGTFIQKDAFVKLELFMLFDHKFFILNSLFALA